jgi:hypothetical protein
VPMSVSAQPPSVKRLVQHNIAQVFRPEDFRL